MSDWKAFATPVFVLGGIAGLLYTNCPAAEERQPHAPHQDYTPLPMRTISYAAMSSLAAPAPFIGVVDSADVALARHGSRRDSWQRTIGVIGSVTADTFTLK